VYKHYETSDDVFVDREEYIEWMNEALQRCKKKSVVLHLKGIGGIGKSSLLKHWIKTKEKTVRVDCEQHTTFYDRLNIIAKGAILHGVSLQRFDILWQIRQRFVEGVEPVKEEGREWAKDIVMAIPFIGSLATIGSAITAIGSKVTPKLKGKYSIVGKWLQERLGKNHIEKLLEILWKEPRHAEFLYLDALLEDINNRNDESPIVFLMDHFEYVDSDTTHWRYQGRKINEVELWSIFLCSLENCVGVMAGRKSLVKRMELQFEENELTELDRDSCIEMLDLQKITDRNLQEKIISVTGGNPFVIDAICDMRDEGTIALDDIESLRADTLEEVRLKTWRRLFNITGNLQDIINRAGLLNHFNRDLLNIVAPSLTTDIWDRLLRMSFVRARDDGTWVLHDLARELIIAELGVRGKSLAEEVAQLFERESDERGDLTLIGHAFSIKAIFSEGEVIDKAKETILDLIKRDAASDALLILDNTRFQSMRGKAELQGLKGKALTLASRFPDAEEAIREAIRVNEELTEQESEKHLDSVAEHLCDLWELLQNTRIDEARDAISRALEIQRSIAAERDPKQLSNLARILVQYGLSQRQKNPLDGEGPMREAISIYKEIKEVAQVPFSLNALSLILLSSNRWDEADEVIREAIELQRRLIETEPDNLRLKAVLAAMFHNLAFMKDYLGDIEEAELLHTEALQIRRDLADRDSNVYMQRLVSEIWTYSIFCFRIYKLEISEHLSAEVLEIAKENVEESPEEYEPWIERALISLSHIYMLRGKTTQAISSINQAVKLSRKRVECGSSILGLTIPLSISSQIRMRSGDYETAEETMLEVIRIFRSYEPLSHRSQADFAFELNNYGIILWRTGRLSEAKEALEEALEISRRKVEESPEVYNGLLSVVLNNCSIILADNDELQAVEPYFEEALSIAKYLAKRTPEIYKIHLAAVLHNYSIFLSKADRKSEAVSSLKRAVEIKRVLVKKVPGVFETSLAKSVNNLEVINRDDNGQMKWEERIMDFGDTP
jgi:tetratricopeptide (TPR) repeat protein